MPATSPSEGSSRFLHLRIAACNLLIIISGNSPLLRSESNRSILAHLIHAFGLSSSPGGHGIVHLDNPVVIADYVLQSLGANISSQSVAHSVSCIKFCSSLWPRTINAVAKTDVGI